MDTLSEEQRSYNMSLIRSQNTKPELTVRSMLHRLGYRFTVKGPGNRALPGKPDIVLPKHQTVVFVHGCFWHGHEGCKDHRIPKTRTEWWRRKIEGNAARDLRNEAALRELGWHVVTIWTCEMKTTAAMEALPARIEAAIRSAGRLNLATANGRDRRFPRSKPSRSDAPPPAPSLPSRRRTPLRKKAR